ncbi:MAG TPA: hypothetical protein DER23_06545 [Clostridiales bacterium]|jgi:LPXTG-site transpeptidase (sortase) family protein|nr:hypothetical protein [Clostridiales bacterium]
MNKYTKIIRKIYPCVLPLLYVAVLLFVLYVTIWQQLSPIISAASLFIASEDATNSVEDTELPSIFDNEVDYSDLPYIIVDPPSGSADPGEQDKQPENDTNGGSSSGGKTSGGKTSGGSSSGGGSSKTGYKQYLAEETYPTTYLLAENVSYPKYNEHYAMVDIYGREVKIFFGDGNAVLKKGAGQSMGSMPPGFGRPILLGGHNNSYFKNIKKYIVGDVITITTNYGVYYYRVYETKIAGRNDYNATHLEYQKEELILYTCYPFSTLRLTKQRYFVYAEKIAGPIVVNSLSEIPASASGTQDANNTQNTTNQ